MCDILDFLLSTGFSAYIEFFISPSLVFPFRVFAPISSSQPGHGKMTRHEFSLTHFAGYLLVFVFRFCYFLVCLCRRRRLEVFPSLLLNHQSVPSSLFSTFRQQPGTFIPPPRKNRRQNGTLFFHRWNLSNATPSVCFEQKVYFYLIFILILSLFYFTTFRNHWEIALKGAKGN